MAGLNLNVGNYFGTSVSGVSTLFSSLKTSGTSSLASLVSDYSSIRSGSYGKLVRSYYNKSTESTDDTSSGKKTDNKSTDSLSATNSALSTAKSAAGSLQNAAKKLTATGDDSLFNKKQVTGANGIKTQDYDKDAIYGAVSDFVKSYNSAVQAAGNSSAKSVENSANSMASLTKAMSKSLSGVGITVGDDGKLSVSEEKFKSSDMSKVKSLFNGTSSYAGSVASSASIMATSASNAMGMVNGALYNSYGSYGGSYSYSGSLYASYF